MFKTRRCAVATKGGYGMMAGIGFLLLIGTHPQIHVSFAEEPFSEPTKGTGMTFHTIKSRSKCRRLS